MFFDDRLSTVLRQEISGEIAQRTQFRQLLDILGNRKFGGEDREPRRRDQSLIAAAWLRMDALGRSIPANERAAMVREPSWRFRSADLAAHLADFEPEVASAALNRAQLSAEDWTALIPRLPVRARGFLRLRRDLPVDVENLLDRLGVSDRGLPSPQTSSELLTEDGQTPKPDLLRADPIYPQENANVRRIFEGEPQIKPKVEPVAPPPRVNAGTDDLASIRSAGGRRDPDERGRSEISALVERIAQFKRDREPINPQAAIDSARERDLSPRLPLGEAEPASARRSSGFGFSTDAAGRIEWAESEVASMVTGIRLVTPRTIVDDAGQNRLERAFGYRQPIIQAARTLAGAPAIAGDWIVDAQPRFTDDGHFTGYVGRFRRPAGTLDDGMSPAAREADRIRQLLHELRTPVTAVQGYAEVIQQQLFGPAPHEYRALAAAIAADAARILAGFEELDRLSRLEGGAITMEPGDTDLASLAQRTAQQLAQVLKPRMAGIEIAVNSPAPVHVGLDPEEAELLVWRFMATLGGGCGAGETLRAVLEISESEAHLVCDLPRQLQGEDDIFTAEAKPIGTSINAGVFGAGFALRVARAEARGAGGDLTRTGEQMRLTIPLLDLAATDAPLTQDEQDNSHDFLGSPGISG